MYRSFLPVRDTRVLRLFCFEVHARSCVQMAVICQSWQLLCYFSPCIVPPFYGKYSDFFCVILFCFIFLNRTLPISLSNPILLLRMRPQTLTHLAAKLT